LKLAGWKDRLLEEYIGPLAFYGKNERWWRELLSGGTPILPFRHFRRLFGMLPTNPRCKFCHGPFDGPGSVLMRLIGKRPSGLTPQLCNQCEAMARTLPGGAEIELTMMFADIRGSTTLAEQMNPMAYSQLINRFFVTASEELVETRSLVDRLVGDQVVGLYVPGFAGRHHAQLAVEGARELLLRTGHAGPDGPWAPVGIGLHTDLAFVGAVGTEGGATDITVLGDAPNTAARLSSSAAAGEILISEGTCLAARLDTQDLESRELDLKGKEKPVSVRVLKVTAAVSE
jgi:adenylate cyclase